MDVFLVGWVDHWVCFLLLFKTLLTTEAHVQSPIMHQQADCDKQLTLCPCWLSWPYAPAHHLVFQPQHSGTKTLGYCFCVSVSSWSSCQALAVGWLSLSVALSLPLSLPLSLLLPFIHSTFCANYFALFSRSFLTTQSRDWAILIPFAMLDPGPFENSPLVQWHFVL